MYFTVVDYDPKNIVNAKDHFTPYLLDYELLLDLREGLVVVVFATQPPKKPPQR